MSTSRIYTTSADGTELHATDTGRGPPVLIVHGGMQAAMRWADVAERLADRFRVVALERRIYGRSGPPRSPHAMAREAEDVAAMLTAIGQPAILLGHSSGGIAALEGALLHPPAGLMLYEPPVALAGMNFGGSLGEADAALARGDADEALRLFFVEMVGIPDAWVDHMRNNPEHPGGWAEMLRMLPMQLDDVRALRALPHDVERYRAIGVPTLLIEGELSPPHLRQRLATLHAVIAGSETTTIAGHGHSANLEAPDKLAAIIDGFASRVFRQLAAA